MALTGWVQSERKPRPPSFNAADHGLFLRSHDGLLSLTRFEPAPNRRIDIGPLRSFLGFHYRSISVGWLVAVPYWFLTLAAVGIVVLLARCLARMLATKSRFQSNLCTACGYDLRATPARCPECGTAASQSG
jgi:hypothetical protein